MKREEQQTEHHLPGHEYAGPGTKVLTKLLNHVQPVNYLDKVARKHDVGYLKPGNQQEADRVMISELGGSFTPVGEAVTAIFGVKDLIGYHPDTSESMYKYAKSLLDKEH